MTTYRAAIYCAPQSAGVVLTGPEHAALSDDDLLAEALREAAEAGLIGDDGDRLTKDEFFAGLHIGEWME